jgi:hypothetical protein
MQNISLNMHSDPVGTFIHDNIMVDTCIVPNDSDYDTVREMDTRVDTMT